MGKIALANKNDIPSLTIVTFTATSDNTTNIVHNLVYNPLHDDLLVIYTGILLEPVINYTENANNISINLADWSINTGEKVNFKLYKNIK